MIINNKNLVALLSTNHDNSSSVNVMHYVLSTRALMKMSNQMDSEISELIDNFQTRLGYPAPITAQEVIDYISLSAELFAVLVALKRSQNSRNLVDVHNKKIGKLFSDEIRFSVENDFYLPELTNINLMNGQSAIDNLVVTSTPNISNSQWVNLVTRATNAIRIPVVHANLIDYYFSNIFSNHNNTDDGINSLIRIHPNYVHSAFASDNSVTWAEGLLIDLKKLTDENSFLTTFLELEMGLGNFTSEFDFTRDLRGETISIVDDRELIFAIETNPMINYPSQNYTVDPVLQNNEVIYSPGDVYYTPFNAPRVGNVNAEDYIHKMIFSQTEDERALWGDSVLQFMLIHSFVSNSGEHTFNHVLPELVYTGLNDITNQLTFMNGRWSMWIPFHAGATLEIVDGKQKIVAVEVYLKTSFNTFLVNEDDFNEVKELMMLEWLFATSMTHSGINRVAQLGVYLDDTKPKQSQKDPVKEKNPKKGSQRRENNKPKK